MSNHEVGLDQDLSQKIIGAAYEVSNVLGVGFLEKVYERALQRELMIHGLSIQAQHRIEVFYKDECVGDYMADYS